jgi:hypothetical protein
MSNSKTSMLGALFVAVTSAWLVGPSLAETQAPTVETHAPSASGPKAPTAHTATTKSTKGIKPIKIAPATTKNPPGGGTAGYNPEADPSYNPSLPGGRSPGDQ